MSFMVKTTAGERGPFSVEDIIKMVRQGKLTVSMRVRHHESGQLVAVEDICNEYAYSSKPMSDAKDLDKKNGKYVGNSSFMGHDRIRDEKRNWLALPYHVYIGKSHHKVYLKTLLDLTEADLIPENLVVLDYIHKEPMTTGDLLRHHRRPYTAAERKAALVWGILLLIGGAIIAIGIEMIHRHVISLPVIWFLPFSMMLIGAVSIEGSLLGIPAQRYVYQPRHSTLIQQLITVALILPPAALIGSLFWTFMR